MNPTYPLVSEVVLPGATYRDLFRPEGRHPVSFRARIIRPTGPAFPKTTWITRVIQCEDRRYMSISLIVPEGHLYGLRTGRGAGWAGKSVEPTVLPAWWPKPDKPYEGLQVP